MMIESLWWHMLVGPTTRSRPKTPHIWEGMVYNCLVSSFQCYLYGSPFTMVMDHQPFKFFMESDQLTIKMNEWVIILSKNMILILFIGLVGLIRMLIGWFKIWVPTRRIPQGLNNMVIWIWRWYWDGIHVFTNLCTLLGCFRDIP